MAFDITRPFHVAQVVLDLDRAMDDLGQALGLTWHSVQERVMHIRWRGEPVEAHLRFTYSVEGDPQVELLEGSAGSVWGPDMAGMHHIGVWTDDFETDVLALEAAGSPIEVTLAGRDDRPRAFTYHVVGGLRVELVPVEVKASFDRWFAGGEFA